MLLLLMMMMAAGGGGGSGGGGGGGSGSGGGNNHDNGRTDYFQEHFFSRLFLTLPGALVPSTWKQPATQPRCFASTGCFWEFTVSQ